MRRHGIRPAAFIADSIFSSDGIFPDPQGLLQDTVKLVQGHGALFIADEVQPGFGRTGTHMWGFQRHGIVPDIVVMGKPMGNGMPIAAAAMKHEIQDRFGRDIRYFNTFGANNVSIAAASAVLDVIEDERLMQNAAEIGQYLRDRMNGLRDHFPFIAEARGAGLFLGLEFVNNSTDREPDGAVALRIVNALRKRRVLVSASGIHGHVLKIRPPLPFGKEHADLFMSALEESLDEL